MTHRIRLLHEKYGRHEARIEYYWLWMWWLEEPVFRGTSRQAEAMALYWKVEYKVDEVLDLRELKNK